MKSNNSFFKQTLLSVALSTTVVLASSATYAGVNANSISEAVTQGDTSLILRYRYEFVDQDNVLKDANASTLKTRFNFKTKSWNSFSVMLEADHVSEILSGNYNDATGTGNGNYSVVADPTGTDLNQAWVQYKTDDNLFRYGRQRIVLDNHRFIGSVGWRQNEQTYDAATYQNSSIADTTISYSYIWNVNRIFGSNSAKGDIESDSHVFHLAYNGLSFGKLSTYGYFLDAQDGLATNPSFNTATVGIRLTGSELGSDKNWGYQLEYADQSDYDDNTTNFSADYFLAKGEFTANEMTFGLGYEVLSADSSAGMAFSTPLATLHAQNGWADQFLGTPADGLEDLTVSFSTKLSDYKLTVVAHDYSAESSGNDYGSELDISLARKYSDNYSLLLKYAAYSAGDIKVDTNKLWIMFTAKY